MFFFLWWWFYDSGAKSFFKPGQLDSDSNGRIYMYVFEDWLEVAFNHNKF